MSTADNSDTTLLLLNLYFIQLSNCKYIRYKKSKEIDSKVAKLTLEKLKKVGANIIGVVLNKFRSEQYNYYSYYSYYGYDDNRKGIFRRKKKKKKHR